MAKAVERWTRESIVAVLREVGEQMHTQHPEARARLEQLDSHLSTVVMVVEHIFDEAVRQ